MKTNTINFRFFHPVTLVVILTLHILFISNSYAQNSGGVLVVWESSQVQKISVIEIRRIYLGLPSSKESLIKKPVINSSDLEVYKIFLKNIMHMTEKGYRRKIVKRIFRQGGEKVKEVKDLAKLINHLKKNVNDISFMDQETAKKTKGIKVVQVLW